MADEDGAVFLKCEQWLAAGRKLERQGRLGKHGVMKKSMRLGNCRVFWD
jgi:hypothetical protein